jgi:hypothetical protein
MRELSVPLAPAAVDRAGPRRPRLSAVEALYYAFIVAIPVETLIYFQRDAENPDSSVSLSRVVGAALLAVSAVQWRRCYRRLPAGFWLAASYAAAYAASALWVPRALMPAYTESLPTLLQMTALFLISINLFAEPEFRKKALRVFGWWTAAVAVLMLLGVFGVQLDEESRRSVASQDPNVTAALFSLGALCIAGDEKLLRRPRSAARAALSLAAVGVMALAVLRTGSRGGLLAFATGFAALAACGGGRTRAARAAVAALVLGIAGGLVQREFALHTATAARLERSWDEGDTAGRREIYDEAWTMFLERPELGYGGANNRFVLGARLNYPDRDTHNVFLAVLTEVGLLGGLGFFLALLWGLVSGWRGARRTGDALPFALLAAELVIGSSITASKEKIFWIVLAAALAAGLRARSRAEEPA